MNEEESFLELIKIIKEAGQQARSYFLEDNVSNEQKEDGSVVTQVDKKIESILVSYIKKEFPEDRIVGEEGGSFVGNSSYVWHVDPIDGTNNFLRKIPFCAISVARLASSDRLSWAVVHNPITQQTFSVRGGAPVAEDKRAHVINEDMLGGGALVSVQRGREEWMRTATYNLQKYFGTTYYKGASFGSCALELAYVAANRIDGVLIFGLNSYDYAAGLLLVRTGGGIISVYENNEWHIYTGTIKELCDRKEAIIFASHSGIHKEVCAAVGDPKDWAD